MSEVLLTLELGTGLNFSANSVETEKERIKENSRNLFMVNLVKELEQF